MGEATAETVRTSRFWLYTPFILLILIAVAWSAAWFVIRSRTVESIDAWFGLEARAGRQWTCRDRNVGGYPFRLEVTCGSLTVQHGPVTASLGRVEAVAQIYQPRFVITEVDGPLHATDGTVTVDGRWDLLQTSVHATEGGLQRLSVVANGPQVTVAGLTPEPLALSGRELEFHVRPDPARRADKAYDVALSVAQARIPPLDSLIGGAEPADLQADLTVTQAEGFRGRPVAAELERWRQDGGRIAIETLAMSQGARRIEARGELGLDEQHRPAGTLDVAAAGLGGLLGKAMGGRTGGGLLGALFGGPAPSAKAEAKPALVPLPPLRVENGFLAVGPFALPNVKVPALY